VKIKFPWNRNLAYGGGWPGRRCFRRQVVRLIEQDIDTADLPTLVQRAYKNSAE
jgi:hypothetical protein